jgi:hypothetical protein
MEPSVGRSSEPPPMNPNYTTETNEQFEARLTKLRNEYMRKEEREFTERANAYDESSSEIGLLDKRNPFYYVFRKARMIISAIVIGFLVFFFAKGMSKSPGTRLRIGSNIELNQEQQNRALKELHDDIIKMEKKIEQEMNLSEKEAKMFRKEIRREAVKRVKQMRESF